MLLLSGCFPRAFLSGHFRAEANNLWVDSPGRGERDA
jgi:hypothetical protein